MQTIHQTWKLKSTTGTVEMLVLKGVCRYTGKGNTNGVPITCKFRVIAIFLFVYSQPSGIYEILFASEQLQHTVCLIFGPPSVTFCNSG